MHQFELALDYVAIQLLTNSTSFFPQVEGGWKLSASFPVDSVGEYTLRLTRQVDASKLKHISTRRSSEYDVAIPCMEVRQAKIEGSGLGDGGGFFSHTRC